MMFSQTCIIILLLPALTLSSSLRKRVVDCSFFYAAPEGATCQTFADTWSIPVELFKQLNPGVGCPNLIPNQQYCVIGTVAADPTSSATSKSTTAASSTQTTTTSTTTTTVSPPQHSPTQPGLASNCDNFHLVKSGDQCNTIAAEYGITSSQLYSWNPSINKECTNLFLGYWICIHVPGASTTTFTNPTSTKPTNGVPTPTPTQPMMLDYCSKFYFVNSGETCGDVARKNGISIDDIIKWNPSAGKDCTGLWANTYACIGVLPDIGLATRYHNDCTGNVHNLELIQHGDGHCVNTDCQVAALEIAAEGTCPGGQIRISYWGDTGCAGKWFGYGYASRSQCRVLWSNGYKFKSLYIRCASKESDCITQGTCSIDAIPSNNLC